MVLPRRIRRWGPLRAFSLRFFEISRSFRFRARCGRPRFPSTARPSAAGHFHRVTVVKNEFPPERISRPYPSTT